jgi:hypothetical protein
MLHTNSQTHTAVPHTHTRTLHHAGRQDTALDPFATDAPLAANTMVPSHTRYANTVIDHAEHASVGGEERFALPDSPDSGAPSAAHTRRRASATRCAHKRVPDVSPHTRGG